MRNRYFGIICLCYSILIFYLWIANHLKNFLAPTMQVYLKISCIPLAILGLVLLFMKEKKKMQIVDLFLMIPLFFFFLSGDGRLTSALVKNKNQQNTVVSSSKKTKDEVITYDFPSDSLEHIDFPVKDETYAFLGVYLSFAERAIEQEGKTIRVRGFITKDSRINPKGYFSIGKYEITCCAADAGFLGFLVEEATYFQENKWYEVEGILQKTPKNQQQYILSIQPTSVKEIDSKKEEQYVYPCYSYGDGNCKEVQNYHLEY